MLLILLVLKKTKTTNITLRYIKNSIRNELDRWFCKSMTFQSSVGRAAGIFNQAKRTWVWISLRASFIVSNPCCFLTIINLVSFEKNQATINWDERKRKLQQKLLKERTKYVVFKPFCYGQDATQGQFLRGVQQVWNQSFPSPKWLSMSYYLPIGGGRTDSFMSFQVLLQSES